MRKRRRPLPLDVHVVPLYDDIWHPMRVQCPCRPAVHDYGPMRPRLVVHHAADGREYREGGDPEPEVIH